MKFSFSGRHMEIGESLTHRAEEMCATLAEKYGAEFIDVNIVMKKEKHLFYCDVAAKTDTGNSYHASNEADDPMASFLGVLHKIDLQMRKRKKACRQSYRESSVEFNSYDNSLEKEEHAPIIVAEILDDLPLLSVSDATKRLNGTKGIFVFENITNNAVNVVYKRDDGNFGWIDYKTKNI
jgi:ribosomal subunit interface protein